MNEIDKYAGAQPESTQIQPQGRQPRSKALERYMRVYGHDFMVAMDNFEAGFARLDEGNPATAATMARRAAQMLSDAAFEQDSKRPMLEVISEIAEIFPPNERRTWDDGIEVDKHFLAEIAARLRISVTHAYEMYLLWRDAAKPTPLPEGKTRQIEK